MRCEEALLLISGRIDGANTKEEDALLQEHLDNCEECRTVLQAYLEADCGIADLTDAPSADFTAKVMAAIEKETALKTKKKFPPYLSLLATAAAVALIIGLGAVRPTAVMPDGAAPMAARTMAEEESYVVEGSCSVEESCVTDETCAVEISAESIAMERQANVVVLEETLPEIETCPSEMLADGSMLYALASVEMAEELSLSYDLELVVSDGAETACAWLAP